MNSTCDQDIGDRKLISDVLVIASWGNVLLHPRSDYANCPRRPIRLHLYNLLLYR